MVSRVKFITPFLAVCCLLFAEWACAGPWISAGDIRTRHHIQYLVDSGAMNLPTCTFPMPWVGVKQSLDNIERKQLTEQQLWSVSYLQHEFQKTSAPSFTYSQSYLASYAPVGGGFDASLREAHALNVGVQLTGEQIAANLAGTFIDDASDNKGARANESYLAILLGNWALGIGSQSQWWGPGWHDSAILSNFARPAPSLFIRRNSPDASNLPIVRALGAWQLDTFASALQQRHPDQEQPILWGMRLAFTPMNSLTLGLAQTAIWADPELVADYAIEIDASDANETFNNTDREKSLQIRSIDSRWGFSFATIHGAMYAQAAWQMNRDSEDSLLTGVAGLELAISLLGTHSRFIFEASNALADFNSDPILAASYNSDAYTNGYRHLQSSMAQRFDSDSEVYSFSGQHYFPHGQTLKWQWQTVHWQANSVQSHSYYGSPAQTRIGRIQYQFPVNERLMAEIGANYLQTPLVFKNEEVDSGLSLSLFHYW